MAERYRGYLAALAEAGLSVDEGLMCHGANDVESARAAGAALLASPAPPTAFFGANNQMTVGLVEAMTAAGRRIAVVGFDDFELADRCPSRSRSCALTYASSGGSRPSCCYVGMGGWTGEAQRIVLPVERGTRLGRDRPDERA